MRLKEEQLQRVADIIVTSLVRDGHIVLKGDRGVTVNAVKGAIADNIRQEAELEREADRLLEQTLRAMGGQSEIDRGKMLRMIKDRLAKERKFVL